MGHQPRRIGTMKLRAEHLDSVQREVVEDCSGKVSMGRGLVGLGSAFRCRTPHNLRRKPSLTSTSRCSPVGG